MNIPENIIDEILQFAFRNFCHVLYKQCNFFVQGKYQYYRHEKKFTKQIGNQNKIIQKIKTKKKFNQQCY